MLIHKLKYLCKMRGTNLTELALKVKMTKEGFNRSVHEEKLSVDKLRECAAVLRVPVSALFDGDKNTDSFPEGRNWKNDYLNLLEKYLHLLEDRNSKNAG